MPYMERNPSTGKWLPTQEAVELVQSGLLYIEKQGQEYMMIDSRQKISQNNEISTSQEMHDTMYHTNSWDSDFPSVFSNALYKELKRDNDLENLRLKAKAGDRDAADELVHEIADYEMIRNLKETFPDAIVAPVIAEEASGNNQVPYAYANLLRENGFEIDTNIIQSVRSHHTGANSIKRFTNRVRFDGEVQKGKSYILVDDHIDYGGTLRDFKDYIEANGGKVLAFSTLTAIDKDIKICPTKENIEKLNNYGDKVDELLKQFGITDNKNGLTNGEVEGLINLLSDKNRNREFESEDQRRFCILCKEIADAYQSKIKQEERTKPILNRFLKLTSNLTIEEQKNLSDKINKISEAIKSENHDVIRLVQSFNKPEYSKKSPNFSQDILNADIKNLLITSSIALIDIKETEKGKEKLNENTDKSKTFDSTSSIILGKTILPSFAVIADKTLHSVENAVVKSYDKEKKSYLVDNGTEKLELPKATFDTLFNDKLDKDRTEAKIAEGRTIVFRNKEMGIQGTVIPEFAMYTQKGLETFKDCVPVQYNKSENTYTISNEKTSITISAEQFREITSPERFENKFDENTPAWKKLCEQQYKDFFQQRDNTAYNFRHNLSVYCRKEAGSPCDALHLAKEIISRMSAEEQKQTKKLLKSMAHEGESTNELIARVYHEAIKGQPLNEDYIKKYEPNSFIKRPFYDTVSENGQKIEDDPTLIRGETDRNLKIGMSIKNVNIETDKLFGKGKDALHFDSLKVISASKETNTITLMDSNKSYFKLPRDTVLAHYKEQQMKEMKIEQRHNRNNSINLSYS